jgi:ribosomal protein S18 acetylase RimI-like enzyme
MASAQGEVRMIVRRAVMKDLPILVEFTSQEAREAEGSAIDLKRLETGIRGALEDPSIAMYWLMVDETTRPIGSISSLKEWSDWNAGYYWWIQSMYIVPDQRGRGHMNKLLNSVLTEMMSQSGLELRLYVHQGNRKAIRAYEKFGFEKSPYEMMAFRNKH